MLAVLLIELQSVVSCIISPNQKSNMMYLHEKYERLVNYSLTLAYHKMTVLEVDSFVNKKWSKMLKRISNLIRFSLNPIQDQQSKKQKRTSGRYKLKCTRNNLTRLSTWDVWCAYNTCVALLLEWDEIFRAHRRHIQNEKQERKTNLISDIQADTACTW